MADSCTPLSWLASQGSARPPVQAGDIHTSASSPVSLARMLCCICPRAPTDTILENLQFTRCLLTVKNRMHPQSKKLVLSTLFASHMTNLAACMAECCSFPSWLGSQGSARHPVQAGDIYTSAWTPVTRAHMFCCICQWAATDTMLGNLQFFRCLLTIKNRRHTQSKKLVLSSHFL